MSDPDDPHLNGLSVSEKMVLALKGDQQTRMKLVRDENRPVWAAVLASPNMDAQDAELVSEMRDVQPDVLREIGKQREWMRRHPAICVNLVMNPVTPEEIALTLLPRLSQADLGRVIDSEELSSHIRGAAKELREARFRPN